MRTLPASVSALLATGTFEPINILRVYWSDVPTLYSDKTNTDYGILGKILSLSNIEDVRSLTNGTLDMQFEVTLDDTDSEFRNILANKDIHGVRVELLQWFAEVPFSDAFKLFEGIITTPINYSSGASQLTLTVLNKLEDREFGFSAEEGQFDYLPPNMVGKAWPVVFGQVASVPIPQIAEAPSAILAEGFGVVNDAAWDAELAQLYAQLALAQANRASAFALGVQEAYLAAQFEDPFDFGGFGVTDDPTQAKTHREASVQAFAQANQYALDANTIGLEIAAKLAEKAEQESYERTIIPIVSSNLPNGIPLTFRLNDLTIVGTVLTDRIAISSSVVNQTINNTRPSLLATNTNTLGIHKTEVVGDKFYWIDGGTKLQMKNFVLSYVIVMTPVTVATVKARQNGVYVKVPTSYYTIEQPVYTSPTTGQTIQPTILRLFEPLTAKNDDSLGIRWDNDELFVDVTGTVGSNVVDILEWIIDNYTTYGVDATTFNHVRTLIAQYSANFAITERKNTFQLLREIAYQARCVLWTNDEKFYISYAPEKQTPVVTLTLDDVELNSLELFTDDAESLVTKYIALWRPSRDYPEPYRIIYRYNVERYGTREEEYDYYIYNNLEAVRKSAEYWTIKQSNAWKRLRFNVSMEHMELEAFDAVEIDFDLPWIVDGPVTGIIERAVLDTENAKVSLEVWLPVRFGEVTEYVYATPKDVVEKYPKVNDTQIRTGNPVQGVKGELVNRLSVLGTGGVGINFDSSGENFFGSSAGRDDIIADANDSGRNFDSVSTYLNPREISANRPGALLNYNNNVRYDVKPYVPVEVPQESSATYPGTVIEYSGVGIYRVDVYFKGFNNPPETVRVQQWSWFEDDQIGSGTPVTVYRLTTKQQGAPSYFMQPPVWAYEDV